MEKTRSRENIASSEGENKSTSSSKTQPEVDFSDLIHELAEINQKGNSLFKESKLDLAQNELIKGDEIFQKEAQKLYNLYIDHPNFEKILALFKTNLSLIAKTFFEQKDYNKPMDLYQRNMLNMNQPISQQQENNELYLSEIDRLKNENEQMMKIKRKCLGILI